MKTVVSTERFRVIRLEPEERFRYRRINIDTIILKNNYFTLSGVNARGTRVQPSAMYRLRDKFPDIPKTVLNEIVRCLLANEQMPYIEQVDEA